jgi:IS1 family transposase
MNRLSLEKRTKIINLLVEGCSIRATCRLVDVSKNTVTKLLVEVGQACLKFHSETVIQIRAKHVQCDEIWSFVYSKQKNTKEDKYGVGNVWTWIAIDSDTKLVISWFAGERDEESAKFFMNDLWCRLRTRVQLSTDGLVHYKEAVADTFGGRVDFAQLVKQYSNNSKNLDGRIDKRMKYIGAQRIIVEGSPEKQYISTSYIERQNLTMRMHMRRFTRKTNAFSKKMENHCYAIALHFVYYNFVKIHSALRVTPAMEAGLTKKLMKIEDIVNLVDNYKVSN